MEPFFYEGQVMWSQVDANMHLRHSAYADFAAQARLMLLEKLGFTTKLFQQYHIGPILFREELIYMREVSLNDMIKVSCELTKMRSDGSRWSFTQEVFRSDGVKAAVIHADGAWMDTEKRKLTGLPEALLASFDSVPKSADFVLETTP
jgi:acyl-CoA thioester hydrolase